MSNADTSAESNVMTEFAPRVFDCIVFNLPAFVPPVNKTEYPRRSITIVWFVVMDVVVPAVAVRIDAPTVVPVENEEAIPQDPPPALPAKAGFGA